MRFGCTPCAAVWLGFHAVHFHLRVRVLCLNAPLKKNGQCIAALPVVVRLGICSKPQAVLCLLYTAGLPLALISGGSGRTSFMGCSPAS